MSEKHLINIFIVLITLCQIFCIPIPDQIENNDQLDYQNHVYNRENIKDNQIKNDVHATIDQVQKMLEVDPNLPRLTKGEIEDLFEQVTREEYDKSINDGDVNRAEHMRALMLVLPYNTDNSSKQNLEELFNRPPVTRVVANSIPKPHKPLRPVIPTSGKVEIISIGNPNVQPTTYKPTFRRKVLNSSPTPITTYHPEQSSFSRSPTSTDNLSDNFEIISIGGGNKKQLNHQFINKSNYPKKYDLLGDIQSETTEKQSQQRFSSHYNAKTINFKKDIYHNNAVPADNSRQTTKTNDLEDVLNSLGFSRQTQSQRQFKQDVNFAEIELPKPIISSIIKQDRVSVDEPIPVNIEDFTKSLVPQPKTEAFSSFKPLNLQSSVQLEPGLEDYLIKFGILEESSRNSRSQKVLNVPPKIEKNLQSTTITLSTTTTTEKNKPIFLDIAKRIDTNIDESITDGITHSFNPTQTDKDDFQELGRLLNNLRELQELRVNLTDDNIKKLELNNYNLSDSLLAQGPNPIDMPEFGDLQKNEVKRQDDDTTETAPTRFSLNLDDSDLPADVSSNLNTDGDNDSTTTVENDLDTQITTELNKLDDNNDSSIITTTTEESPNGSLSDLEDSFGKLDPITEKPLPPPRKNGFYFLADINSFLEVGDGDEKVVVRFNPQIGDPSRFIPVKVP